MNTKTYTDADRLKYIEEHPDAFSRVKKNEHYLFAGMNQSELDEWKQSHKKHWEMKIPDISGMLGNLATTNLDMKSESGRTALAKDNHTSPALLAKLAKDPNPHIRMLVASNPSTPKIVLDKMVIGEKDVSVLTAIARNTENPKVLTYLSTAKVASIKYSVATNPNTPKEVAERLNSS